MTIEKSPAPFAASFAATLKPTVGAGSHGARAKASVGEAAAQAAGPGAGFMAILGALDGASVETPVSDTGHADALSADAPFAAREDPDAPVPPVFDASTMLQENPQIASSQVAQAEQVPCVDQAAAAAAPALDPTAMAQALAATGLLQPPPPAPPTAASLTQRLSTDAAPLAPPAASTTSRFGDAAGPAKVARAVTATALATPAADSADSADPVVPAPPGWQQALTRAKTGQDAGQSLADTGTAAKGGAAVAGERAESNKFLAAMEQARAATTPRALEAVLAPLVILQEKQEKAQSERRSGTFKDAEPTYSGTTVGTSAPDASLSGAAAPAMAPDMQVAEQVSYWVSHNVQNAELSLDGLGQSPVQVSISLQGNEAQISFRTDEAAARDVLQNAAAHLTDMLQREGLVLTGVSVGHSGSGNADGGERRARSPVRQTQIAPLQAASPDSGPRLRTATAGATGRSVDLFV